MIRLLRQCQNNTSHINATTNIGRIFLFHRYRHDLLKETSVKNSVVLVKLDPGASTTPGQSEAYLYRGTTQADARRQFTQMSESPFPRVASHKKGDKTSILCAFGS